MTNVLIASCIRQKPEILKEFLESLDSLKKPDVYDYFFILSDLEKAQRKILADWSHGKPVDKKTMNFGDPYITDEDTHHWNSKLVSNVIEMKNRILEKAKDYDYLLFVDSDTYLHPETLIQLLSRKKDIITEISWTKWYADDPQVLPSAWFYQKYGFPHNGLERLKNEELVKVGGFGGLYLISKKAMDAGVSFKRVGGLPDDWGEDRHFAVRAQSLGFELWCDTTLPSFHIYRMTDLPKLEVWKKDFNQGPYFKVKDCSWATKSDRDSPDFKEIVRKVKKHASLGEAKWSRCWEYPYVYLSYLEKGMRVLDVGCGESPLKLLLAETCEVHCLDKEEIAVPEEITFKKADMANIPYPDEYFDRVFCISVLEHSKLSPMRYVKEMLRVLKVGGSLLLTLDANRWTTAFRFRHPELMRLCGDLGIDLPTKPDDILKSEDHPDGKMVGEGLSVLGFKIEKLTHQGIEVAEDDALTEDLNSDRVLIAVPHTGNIRAETVSWLVNTIVRHPEYGLNLSYGMPVDSNRNKIVKGFLTPRQRGYNWLLFVDSDIVPPLGVIERLLSHGVKMVSATCWSTMGGETGGRWEQESLPYPVVMMRDEEKEKGWKVAREKITSGNQLIEVDAVGASCLLIHRDVLETVGKSPFRLGYDDWGVVTVVGEDFDFCMKVKKAGFKIYADLTVQCEHLKTVGLEAFNSLLEKMARGEV